PAVSVPPVLRPLPVLPAGRVRRKRRPARPALRRRRWRRRGRGVLSGRVEAGDLRRRRRLVWLLRARLLRVRARLLRARLARSEPGLGRPMRLLVIGVWRLGGP